MAGPMRWPVAAGLVLGVVIAILVGGVLLARHMQVDESRVPAGSQTVVPLATPEVAQVATVGGPSTTLSTPVAVTALATNPAPTRNPTDITTINVAVVNGTPQGFGPGTPVPTPSAWWQQVGPVAPALVTELNNAYQQFWQVRAQAMLDLNPAPLSSVMQGSVLQREIASLDDLRAQNEAAQTDVQHHIQILHGSEAEGALRDDYVSYDVPVDLATQQLLTPTPTRTWHLAYHFEKLQGMWKVVEAVQVI